MSGTGVLTYKNGNVLSGTFVDGILEGSGTMALSDGTEFKGEFVNGKTKRRWLRFLQ